MRFWLNTLDVALVAFIAYFLYINIRNTQAIQLIKGIIVLFVLNLLAQKLGLYLVGRVLDVVVTALLVAIPVIFQPELRRALQRLGGNPRIFDFSNYDGIIDLAAVISDSAKRLADLGWGAIIVIEMDVGLEQYISSGVRLDAICSSQLLLTIFMPGTQLHDGAVVIKGQSIVAGGCFLPLTQQNTDRKLGSRHRAALGLSEVTDSLIIVVSEERRAISFATDGVLYENLDPAELRRMIVSRYKRRDADEKGTLELWFNKLVRKFTRKEQ